MADAYLDHGAYASNLGTTPTWGVPQEGDGTSKDAATASSIASVVFGSVPTSGTISVCGVSVSTSGVLSAASVDAAANALATNINATTTTVAAGVALGVPQLRNLMFARGPSGGAPAGTCEIMMRVGSATLNHATNVNVALAQTLSPAATLNQFAGGSGGCWGWFLNTAALGVSNSIAARTYGIFIAPAMVAGGGFAYGEFDEIFVRTGDNPTVNVGLNSWGSPTRASLNMVFDSNTVWTTDPSNGKFTFDVTVGGGSTVAFANDSARRTSFRAIEKYGFEIGFTWTGASTSPALFDYAAGSGNGLGTLFERTAIVERTDAARAVTINFDAPTYAVAQRGFIECLLDLRATARVSLQNFLFRLHSGLFTLRGNYIRLNLTGVGGAAFAFPLCRHEGVALELDASDNVVEVGQPGELTAVTTLALPTPAGSFIRLRNNSGLGLPAGSIGAGGSPGSTGINSATVILDNLEIGGSAKYEDRRGFVEWVAGQPTLSALSPDGTPWSWLVYWSAASWVIARTAPMLVPQTRMQMRLADGARTLTTELLLDAQALAHIERYGQFELSYVNASGKPVLERHSVTLVASSSTWANVVAAPYNAWVARKFTVTTAQSVKQNTILGAQLALMKPCPGSAGTFAVDPEMAVS